MIKNNIVFIDLPVFPKGNITLALVAVAAEFDNSFDIEIIDLNIKRESALWESINSKVALSFLGIKVSAQNLELAISISQKFKHLAPNTPIVWGGELPTLLPEECLKYADVVIKSMWEPIAKIFIKDLTTNNLKKIYEGNNNAELLNIKLPRFDLIKEIDKYYSYMGLPLETSRGCTEVCAFCMVHIMQKKNYFLKNEAQLREELKAYKNKFVNIVDYNFGVSSEHVIKVSHLIKSSGAIGWMAEMCIELLDNDNVLKAMKESGCRIIYCGLESIEDKALQSVHKMNTNHIENYERIIRKVQGYNIQIASGFILGIEGMNEKTFENTFVFFQRMGIIYVKLTFLTYNPGTKVANYMHRKGVFITDNFSLYDGNHLSYLPNGVNADVVLQGTKNFILKFYSIKTIVARSFQTKLTLSRRLEFILFNICYRVAYFQWIEKDVLKQHVKSNNLLNHQFKKSVLVRLSEKGLRLLRVINK